MRHRFHTLFLAVFLAFLPGLVGCTRNDGNIGKQFGQWKVISITVDGKDDIAYQGNIFWSFQNSTIEMKRVEANHDAYATFGNYRIMDETLFVTFPDDARPPMGGFGLKASVENELHILRMTGSEMILAYESTTLIPGTTSNMTVRLRKW